MGGEGRRGAVGGGGLGRILRQRGRGEARGASRGLLKELVGDYVYIEYVSGLSKCYNYNGGSFHKEASSYGDEGDGNLGKIGDEGDGNLGKINGVGALGLEIPNACEMWKAIEKLKQGESINVQDLETNLYWSLENSHHGMVNHLNRITQELQRFVTLVKQSQELKTISYHKLYDILKQYQNKVNELRAERLAHTANPLALVAQQQLNPTLVAEMMDNVKEKEMNKTHGFNFLYHFKKIYNYQSSTSDTSSNNQLWQIHDNTPRINRGTRYDNQRAVNIARAREGEWDGHDDEPDDQELEAYYMYMAQIQEVTPDAADNFGPIFDVEPLQKGQGGTNITIDSLDMSTNRETVDQDDDDLANERDLLSSLIEKLKCKIDDSKNQANNELPKTNQLMFKDLKKFQAELEGILLMTKIPMAVPISTREHKRNVNQSTATPLKRIVAAESTNQKPRSTIKKQYEQINHVSSDLVPQCPTTALEHASLSPGPQSQENVCHSAETVTTSNKLDLLFSLMFDKLLNGTTPVMLKYIPLNIQTTPEITNQAPTQAPTVTANENIIQAETNKECAQVNEDEFINIFSTPIQEQGETSSRYVDSTRRQLETDGEMCIFALTYLDSKRKNIKEAMADSAWIKAVQEELHQFDRLDV
ncbi:hypothetical protein Tco_0382867 [Tanacetum coccineum]